MFRHILAVLVAAVLAALPPNAAVQRAREREARELTAQRLEAWFGPPPAGVPGPVRRPWMLPAANVDPQRAIARSLVSAYTERIVADAPLRLALTMYLTNRLTEEIFQRQTVSTTGAGFVTERYFGGYVPYSVRSIRLDRWQLGPAEPFDTLERYVGLPTFDAFLGALGREATGRGLTRFELIDLASRVSGRTLTWLFDAVDGGQGELDYGVQQVTVGVASPGRQRTTVIVRRYGDAVFPGTDRPPIPPYQSGRAVLTRIVFADGTVRDEHWDGRGRWTAFAYDSATPVVRVMVDPERVMIADRHVTNNTWTDAPMAAAAANKWSARWMTWLEDAILGWAFFV